MMKVLPEMPQKSQKLTIIFRVLGTRLIEKIDTNNRGIVAVNTTFMLLGLFGIISPSVAAILHNASTIAFSVNAMKPVLDDARYAQKQK